MSQLDSRQAIAIVGMSCRMPGADNLAEYWDLIRSGRQAFGPLPDNRLDRELLFHPEKGKLCKTYTDLGGLVSNRPYDRVKNPIPDELFEQLDHSHKIILELAADACRDAGYDPYNLAERRAGVYIGHTGGSERVSDLIYSTVVEEGAHILEEVKPFAALGPQRREYLQQMINETRQRYPGRKPGFDPKLSALQASGLISEVFGLNGPFMVADAACASSMQSMAAGIRALREGRIEMAFAGGGSYCTSDTLVLFSSAQSVSATGSCPFSTQADGLVAAAGFVILILKTLDKAIADKDNIHAVISGFGVSSDGRGRSLWAPRKEGQILAVQRAYGENNLDPRRVQYIEAHATSTQVGDATELQALSESIHGMIGKPVTKIPIGSVKGNIGHTLETAGMAGIVKTVLALKHKTIPPAIKGDELNSEINWNDCPFHVPFSPQDWPEHADGHPRRAAVNAFGIGGLNVHVVLDEFQPNQPAVRRLPDTKPANAISKKSDPDENAIAIIGMSCIVPGAKTLEAFWDLLMSERDALMEAPRDRMRADLALAKQHETWKTVGHYGGFITDYVYDWRKHKVAPKQVANANPLQFMLLDAADQALKNAGLNEQNMDTLHTAVVVGTTFGGDFCNQIQMGLRVPEFQRDLAKLLRTKGIPEEKITAITAEFHDRLFEKMPAMLDETGSFTSSTLASRITKTFNFMGGAMAIDAGTCSSLLSIQTAVDILRQRDANVVVCASGQRSMDVWVYESFSNKGLLASGKPAAPFSREASGYVPSEGCGVLVLKRLADARRDGNPIQAVIRGIGAASNDNAQQALCEAANAALRDADIPIGAVEAIEMHGMGNSQHDQIEIQATRQTYAIPEIGRKQPLQLGALRHQIGDMGGATGIVSVIKAARSAVEGMLPATAGFTQLNAIHGDGRDANLSARSEKIPAFDQQGYRAIAVTNLNERMAYQLILDNGQPKPDNVTTPTPAKPETAKFVPVKSMPVQTATTPLTLVAPSKALNDLLRLAPQLTVHRFASSSREGLLEQVTSEAMPSQDSGKGAYRLNLVAGSPEELTKKLRFAAEALRTDNWKLATEQGIFFGDPTRSKPRVAFMFPGQGSQYPGMFELLANNFAPAGEALREANSRMLEQGYPTFAELAGPQATGLGSDIWETQISLLIAEYMASRMIASLGVKPDYFAGHSFGELPALLASGVWSLPAAIHATRMRCDAVIACKTGPSAMVSMLADRKTANKILQELSTDIWLCAENSLEQCVVGGKEAAVDRFFDYCKANRITVKKLKVPFAYHTPLLEPTREQLRQALDVRDMDLASAPLLSSTYLRFLADPIDFRDSLVDQMTHPVEYVGVVQKLRARGVDTFLEIGPSQVLTQLTRKILLTDPTVRCLSLDQGDPKTPEALIRMIVALETWGLLGQPNVASTAATPVLTTAAPTPPAVSKPSYKPAPKFVDATEARRARMRSGSRGSVPAKAEARTQKPELVSTLAESKSAFEIPVERRISNLATTNGNGSNGSGTNGNGSNGNHAPSENRPSRLAQFTNGHHDHHGNGNGNGTNGHNGNGNGNGHHGNGNDHSKYAQEGLSSNGNGHHQAISVKEPAPAQLPENWAATLAWLQNQARVYGLSDEFALHLDQPWMSLVLSAESFVKMLLDFYDLNDADRKKLNREQTVDELCRFLCDKPGKSAWLPKAAPETNGASSEEQAKFLIEFVVDQTGYPAEMVDLDANLEADLGIDSIKKAQLFGEIGEKYSLGVDPNMSLDDFPTLRHLLRYIEKSQARNAGTVPASASKPMPPKPSAPTSTAPSATASAPSRFNATATAPVPEPFPVGSSSAAMALLETPVAAPAVVESTMADSAEIESHLINFVIEQTGYPEEMVDLDANLEADLGIDSIKKAQLFGEIGERFSLTADPNQSLDDYPTLRHILAYMLKSRGASAISASPVAPSAKPAPALKAEPVPAPKITTAVPAPVAAAAIAATPQRGLDHGKLAAFLVEFVVEQTGYPEDMVDLDASLEADLGIDSIKKAQLFGEIGERFSLTADPNQSLDDYPTLRHVLQFMVTQLDSASGATRSEPASALKKNDTPPAKQVIESASTADPTQAAFNNGFRRGQTAQQAIRTAIRRRTQVANPTAADAAQYVTVGNLLSETELTELQGLADGAGILVESLRALNFSSDALSGTETEFSLDAAEASFILRGLLPLETAPGLAKNITDAGPTSYEWTVPGFLGCLAGISEHGFAVAVQYPATASSSNQLPAAIVAARVLHCCHGLNSASEMLQSQRWTPGATITVADLAGNQLLRWTADEEGQPLDSEKSVIPSSSSSQIQTTTTLRRLKETAAAGIVTSAAHWLQLIVRGNSAQAAIGDQWQITVSPENQTTVTLPFAIPQSKVTCTVPAARILSPIPFPAGARITQRFLPHLISASRTSSANFATSIKAVAILGQQPVTIALAASLHTAGFVTTLFPETLEAAEIIAKLNSLGPCHLIMSATGEYIGNTSTQWNQQVQGTLLTSFAVCQHWLAQQQLAGTLEQVSLAALTSLGGSLGLAPEIANPLGGGLAGFCKGLHNEHPQLRVKLIDSARGASAADTAQLFGSEWLSEDAELEVALHGKNRHVIRYSEPALPARNEMIPQAGDQWIVTGGARGITAVVAREMAARYGLRLNILGSTDLSDLDQCWLTASEAEMKTHKSDLMKSAKARGADALGAWKDFEKTLEIARNMQVLRDSGLDAQYYVCDVSDWDAVEATLAAIRARGPIRGIMHGAGYEAAAKFEKKKLPQVEKTIQVKAGGAAALMALTANDPLGWFIGFGSTSGRFGGMGQTDYSLANDLLAKQTSWFHESRPDCRTVTVHWHAWGEIGMAARPESKFALEAFGLKMMPPAEGIAYLLTEIDAGLPEREIVITEGRFIPESALVKEEVAAELPLSAPAAEPLTGELPDQSGGISETELQAVMINFVMEQTGYPEDMIDFDAALEADLGIDSIKKAQLFGEIGERYGLTVDPNLSLDDFPTLRHLQRYVLEIKGGISGGSVSAHIPASQPTVETLAAAAPKLFLGPMLHEVKFLAAQRHQALATFDPVADVFLAEHRLNGRPLLPGTFGWELLAQAAAALEPGKSAVRLTNVNILNPLGFANDAPRTVRVNCERIGSRWRTESVTEHQDSSGRVLDETRSLMTGEVEFFDHTPASEVTLKPNQFPFYPMVYQEDKALLHGKNLRTCHQLLFQHGSGWGNLQNIGHQATSGSRPLDGWILPAGLLDGAIVGCAVYDYLMLGGRVVVPHGIEELTLFQTPHAEEKCLMQFRYLETKDRNSWYDFDLFGAENRLLATIRRLRLVTLE